MKKLYIGGGAISHDCMKVAIKDDASTQTLGPVYPSIGLHYLPPLSKKTRLDLSLHTTPVPHQLADKSAKSSIMLLGTGIILEAYGKFNIKLGPGIMLYTIDGAGGTTVQKNGLSTQTFANPSGSATAQTIYLTAGLGYAPGVFRLDIDAIINTPFSKRRALSLLGQLSVGML